MSENEDREPLMKVVWLSELQEVVKSLVQMALEKTAAASGLLATITGGGKPIYFDMLKHPVYSVMYIRTL